MTNNPTGGDENQNMYQIIHILGRILQFAKI